MTGMSDWQIGSTTVWTGTGTSVMFDAIGNDTQAFDAVERIEVWRLYRDGAVVIDADGRPVNYRSFAAAERARDNWPSKSVVDMTDEELHAEMQRLQREWVITE